MTNNETIKAFESLFNKLLDVKYDLRITQKEFKALNTINSVVNRQKAEIERYLHSIKLLEKDVQTANAEIEKYRHIEQVVKDFWSELKKLSAFNDLEEPTLTELLEYIEYSNAEAIKEFAKKFEKKIKDVKFTLGQTWEIQNALKDTLKEMVGDDNG